MAETIVDTQAPLVEEAPAAQSPPSESPSTFKILRRGDQIFEQPPTGANATISSAGQPAAPATTPESPEPAAQTAPSIGVPDLEEEVDFFEYAKDQTKGLITKPDDVFAILTEREQLKKQLAERPQIEFPNDQAKWLYEQAIKFPGTEKESFRSMLHVLSLDMTKLSDKEKQFEAFALENKKLTREKSREYFEARYEKTFGNGVLEADLTAQYDHDIQTEKATDTLQRMQEEFNKMEPSKPAAQVAPQQMSPQELADTQRDVSNVLDHFGGVKYQFLDDPNSTVNVPLEDADVEVIKNYMVDPRTFFEDLTSECMDAEGNFSMDQLAMAMFEFKNRERIREQAFKSGVNFGKLEQIKLAKNITPPPTGGGAPPVQPAKTFLDAFAESVKPLLKPTRAT